MGSLSEQCSWWVGIGAVIRRAHRNCAIPPVAPRLSQAPVLVREWDLAKDCLERAGPFPDSSPIAKGGFCCDGTLFMALKMVESPSTLLVSRMTRSFLLLEEMESVSWGFGAHRPGFECQLSWSLALEIQRHLKKKRFDLEERGPRINKRKNKKEQLQSPRTIVYLPLSLLLHSASVKWGYSSL